MTAHPTHRAVTAYARRIAHDAKLTPTQAHVLIVVASYYSPDTGRAWVSEPVIARDTCRSLRTVERAVSALTSAGVWAVEHEFGRASQYRFPIARTLALVIPTPVTGDGGLGL